MGVLPKSIDFPVTFFVHGPRGPQDTVLQNSGEVVVDLGGDRRKVVIGEQGQAYFPAIPASFRGQEVLAWVSSDKFESADANKKYKLKNQSIYLTVHRKAGRLYGLIESEDPLGDLARHFALYGQRVAQFPVVALRSQVLIRGRMNQLSSDAHLTARSDYRSFNKGVHS